MMGCLESKSSEDNTQPQVFSWDRDDRPDPKDYTISNKNGVTCGRVPGTINGQQFIIEDCQDCSIFILDHVATVTVDNCDNCRIVLGPTKGSVFIRNCKNLKCAIACQQYRSRDCQKIETFLHCQTQPIIESSAGMKFSCLQYCYPGLKEQFELAGLSIFNNTWSVIHDFTPVDGSDNWCILSETSTMEASLPKPATEEFSGIELLYDNNSVLPLTRGKRSKRYDESCLLVFSGKNKNNCLDFLLKLQESYSYDIIQSKEIKMTAEDALRVFKQEKYCVLVNDGALVGLELNGDDDVISHCEGVLKEMLIDINDVFLSKDKKNSKAEIDRFYNFIDMMMT